MSVYLWIDTDNDEAISFGETFAFYACFSEMAKLAGEEWETTFIDLAGVPTATEDVEDVDPAWLADARRQAAEFIRRFGPQLGSDAMNVLQSLTN